MIIDFNKIEESCAENLKNGKGKVYRKAYDDEEESVILSVSRRGAA